MKRNPLIPFALIAVLGIILMIVVGVWGGNTAHKNATGGSSTNASQNLTPDQIFQQNCSQCHGDNLQGGIGPNLQKIGASKSKDQILNQIKNGGGGMPGGLINGKEADAVATWLSKKK